MQGPCEVGTVIMLDRESGAGFCGCNKTLNMYYHADTDQCYQLYTRGPCPLGHILSFNYTTLRPECKCHDGYHYHHEVDKFASNTNVYSSC